MVGLLDYDSGSDHIKYSEGAIFLDFTFSNFLCNSRKIGLDSSLNYQT